VTLPGVVQVLHNSSLVDGDPFLEALKILACGISLDFEFPVPQIVAHFGRFGAIVILIRVDGLCGSGLRPLGYDFFLVLDV
jgi:hypothetical protein